MKCLECLCTLSIVEQVHVREGKETTVLPEVCQGVQDLLQKVPGTPSRHGHQKDPSTPYKPEHLKVARLPPKEKRNWTQVFTGSEPMPTGALPATYETCKLTLLVHANWRKTETNKF